VDLIDLTITPCEISQNFSIVFGISSAKKSQPVFTAFSHFNSSYERANLVDRFVELITAMEVLFGDTECHSYKIPLRCACSLYPPGRLRKEAFMAIEQFYGEKSAIARGSKLENVLQTLGKIDQLEEYVRRSILRFL
jgi:hypothetical protein